MWDEANPILYSCNTFTSVSSRDLECDHVWDGFVVNFYEQVEHNIPEWEPEGLRVERLWKAARKDLVQDVGKTFDADINSLPHWLFEGYFSDVYNDGKSESLGSLFSHVDLEEGLGYQFPAFLRKIGRSNTALIQRIELVFGDLVRGAQYFPIYAEILRQHVPHLRRLLIGKQTPQLLSLRSKAEESEKLTRLFPRFRRHQRLRL